MTHFGIFGHDFNTGGILEQTTVPADTGQFTGTSDFVSSGDSTKQIIGFSNALQNLDNAFVQNRNVAANAENIATTDLNLNKLAEILSDSFQIKAEQQKAASSTIGAGSLAEVEGALSNFNLTPGILVLAAGLAVVLVLK